MIIFIAICMTVLIGFTGLATDTGMIWVTRSRLQNSVDAAVLAAAQDLPAADAAAKTGVTVVACDYATVRNAVPGMTGAACSGKADVTFPTANSIRVKAYRTVQPIFGQILGFDPVEVSAQATAQIGSLGSSCIFPFFLTAGQITASTAFFAPVKFTNDNIAGAAIDVGSGANAVRDAMTSRSCSDAAKVDVTDVISTKPGGLAQFKDGWVQITTSAQTSSCPNKDVSAYLTQDATGRYEMSPSVTLANCPRLLIVPVLASGDYSGGNKSGAITGFIPFYFAFMCDAHSCNDSVVGAMNQNEFWGYYVRLDLTSLTYSEYKPEFGTQVVSLAG